jgi:hypothetical protein
MTTFTPEVQAAVLAHMNGNHPDDNLLIVRAFADTEATAAEMTGFDENEGRWSATIRAEQTEVHVPWPAAPIAERPEVRRELVALYDAACTRLGIAPRPH